MLMAAPMPRKAPLIEWKRGRLLGAGSYGQVFLGLNIHTGQLVAVKQIRVLREDTTSNARRIQALEREIDLLRSMQSPHIVKYIGMQTADDWLYIV
jgi:serine/threonine protein kinase